MMKERYKSIKNLGFLWLNPRTNPDKTHEGEIIMKNEEEDDDDENDA